MTTALRLPTTRSLNGPHGWMPPHVKHKSFAVPDPITFATNPRFLDRPLFPRQGTLLKCIFLRTDLLTDFDYYVIEQWEDSFRKTGSNGTVPGLVDRMFLLKDMGYPWFRELILVLGRRAGKGYISSIAMAYVLWNYMSRHDPQKYYEIDRDKRLACLIYAGRKEQARDNLWLDLYHMITGGPCFDPYIGKAMGESLSVCAPSDLDKPLVGGIDRATFKIDPLPATPMSGRGVAGFMLGFDEMGHMIATGANRSSEEVWVAATPSLDQFGKDAFVVCPSSPWEMIGQFYKEWLQAQELDEDGTWAHPEKLMLQLASWEIYGDWEDAHTIPMFPEDFEGDERDKVNGVRRYVLTPIPYYQKLNKPVLAYDDAMKRLEKADPDTFAVERRSQWQTALNAYLDPAKVEAMFDDELQMTEHGILSRYYKGHGDPGFVNDPFGFAVAHTVPGEDGFEHVVFDFLKQWDPRDYPDHTVDYEEVENELFGYIKSFPLDDLSFDQHNSRGMTAKLSRLAREAQLPKRCTVHIINETAAYNLMVAETFKVALNQGWIHAPKFEIAYNELRFLMFKNGKVKHQDTGPVQHDDVARAMMEVVYGLLERQVSTFLMGDVQLAAGGMGGHKPWMHPSNGEDKEVLGQFGQQARRNRMGTGASVSASRGRPGFIPGRRPPTGYSR